jgi:teichoic acid transport system permease protein
VAHDAVRPSAGHLSVSATALAWHAMSTETRSGAEPAAAGDGPPVVLPDGAPLQWHVYEPHRVGLPPLGRYVRDLWSRREFAFEMSRNELRAQHFNTVFGMLWLILNPVLLAGVYFILIDILGRHGGSGAFFIHLLAALFAYYYVSGCVRQAVTSVVSSGKLILNSAFPRVLLPLSSVLTGFMRFLPTLVIYAIVHVAAGRPINLNLIWTLPLIALLTGLGAGLAMIVSAVQVYFRDLRNFLPFMLRLWLYSSPILYYAHEVPDKLRPILKVNPLAPILTAWSQVLDKGHAPAAGLMFEGLAWAVGLFVIGAVFFVSREREFAVRL